MGEWISKQGEKITEEDAARIAEEAERGYDLTKAKLIRRGRPSLGPAGPSERIQVRVDSALGDALREHAANQEVSLSELARIALREYVNKT